MNPLFLEIDINAQCFQFSYRFQQGNRVSCKTGNGLCQNQVDFSPPASVQQLLKFCTIFLCSRQCLICINTAEQPLRIALDQLIVIADLCRQRMEHGILSAGHSGIGCRPFQQERLFLWKCNFLYHSCRDNLPLSDDILPYDRAGVKEYTAQRYAGTFGNYGVDFLEFLRRDQSSTHPAFQNRNCGLIRNDLMVMFFFHESFPFCASHSKDGNNIFGANWDRQKTALCR